MRRGRALLLGLALAGCSHGEPFGATDQPLGPANAGVDVALTYSTDLDYWPAWTEDGRGILYAFVAPQSGSQHRCIGLLPAGGGTRIWQLCDDRGIQRDSTSSFPAFALGADGRLLYVEAVTSIHNSTFAPEHTTLWLADSANPFVRRPLLSLPTFVGTTNIRWLVDIAWTGPTTFIGLAEEFTIFNQCGTCPPRDTVLFGTAVVRGTIRSAGATLETISGSTGATGYSLAGDGATIVFTLRNDRRLFRIPAAGGTPATVGFVGPSGAQLLGVSCRGSMCVVASDGVMLTDDVAQTFPRVVNSVPKQLWSVSLLPDQVTLRLLRESDGVIATPKISPVDGDVVVQVGNGMFGYLQTFGGGGNIDLHLFPALIP